MREGPRGRALRRGGGAPTRCVRPSRCVRPGVSVRLGVSDPVSVPVCPSAEAAALRERLRGVRHTVLVLSGKGGVGKSTFSALLASGLAADEAKQVRAGRAAEGPAPRGCGR